MDTQSHYVGQQNGCNVLKKLDLLIQCIKRSPCLTNDYSLDDLRVGEDNYSNHNLHLPSSTAL